MQKKRERRRTKAKNHEKVKTYGKQAKVVRKVQKKWGSSAAERKRGEVPIKLLKRENKTDEGGGWETSKWGTFEEKGKSREKKTPRTEHKPLNKKGWKINQE